MKTKVFADGFEGHVERSLERAQRRENGERLEPERIITFADPLDMLECLTPNASGSVRSRGRSGSASQRSQRNWVAIEAQSPAT